MKTINFGSYKFENTIQRHVFNEAVQTIFPFSKLQNLPKEKQQKQHLPYV